MNRIAFLKHARVSASIARGAFLSVRLSVQNFNYLCALLYEQVQSCSMCSIDITRCADVLSRIDFVLLLVQEPYLKNSLRVMARLPTNPVFIVRCFCLPLSSIVAFGEF